MSDIVPGRPPILLVDDNPHDVVLIRLAFRKVGVINAIVLAKCVFVIEVRRANRDFRLPVVKPDFRLSVTGLTLRFHACAVLSG
ncbi:MAG: hypothetical protein FJ403_17700 [Verrucomicrobia bacterium]|nr:hypothetical protein [Verrucomicrobiota bacterium]